MTIISLRISFPQYYIQHTDNIANTWNEDQRKISQPDLELLLVRENSLPCLLSFPFLLVLSYSSVFAFCSSCSATWSYEFRILNLLESRTCWLASTHTSFKGWFSISLASSLIHVHRGFQVWSVPLQLYCNCNDDFLNNQFVFMSSQKLFPVAYKTVNSRKYLKY